MEETLPITPEKNQRRRTYLLRITFFILIGYFITQTATFAARALGLTSMEYFHVVLYASIVIGGTITFLILITLKRNITIRFSNIVFIAQYILYITMYVLWAYQLNEIRVFGLFCALIALTFELSYTNLYQSLMMSLGTMLGHTAVTWYAITQSGQHGDLNRELFFTICILPSFIFIPYVAHQINRQRNEIRQAKTILEATNTFLVKINTELQAEKDMSDVEMELASRIQGSLFPVEPPVVDGWEIAFIFRPKFGVSGDFFDLYVNERTLRGLSIFDVAGHGVPSALITILAKPVFFHYFRRMENEILSEIMEQAHQSIFSELQNIELFITGILLRIRDMKIEYVNAGHPHLLLRRAATGLVEKVGSDQTGHQGSPLGIGNEVTRPCTVIPVATEPGDILLLYTDGLLESFDSQRRAYGFDRLIDSLAAAPSLTAQDALDHVMSCFGRAVNPSDIKDDITAILIRRKE